MKEFVSIEDDSSSTQHSESSDDNDEDKPQLPLDTIRSPPSQYFDYPQDIPWTRLKLFDKIIKDVKNAQIRKVVEGNSQSFWACKFYLNPKIQTNPI